MDQRAPAEKPASPVVANIFRPLERFLHVEAASGILLLIAAIAALLLANSPWGGAFENFWRTPFAIGFGGLQAEYPLRFWLNEGLMTIFFLVVGLEIRRELHEGALSSLQLATLPGAAAIGGIALPALIYVGINPAPEVLNGWAVPTATDIAFAVGVLALLGSRVPANLRALLLAIAIVDDIAAIVMIAVFYSDGVNGMGFITAFLGVIGVLILQRMGVRHALAYAIAGFVIWIGLHQAHVHPTLAGVLLGLLTPVSTFQRKETLLTQAREAIDEIDRRVVDKADARKVVPPAQALANVQREILSPVVRIEAVLHPWVAYCIMPLFALANAGVVIDQSAFTSPAGSGVAIGSFLALVLGKPLGVFALAWIAVRLGIARLPPSVNWPGFLVIGLLAGIGFTMSIFIANLAFDDQGLLAAAKLGVLAASVVAATCGLLLGRLMLGRARSPE